MGKTDGSTVFRSTFPHLCLHIMAHYLSLSNRLLTAGGYRLAVLHCPVKPVTHSWHTSVQWYMPLESQFYGVVHN